MSHLLIPTYKSSLIDNYKAHEKILQWQRNGASKLPNRNKDYIGELTNLTCMKINGNKLSELPFSMIKGMRSLSILEIRGNNLTSLPPFFGNYYHNLRILKLDRNQLSEFPKDDDNVCLMRKCQKLEEINLANNLFTEIPSFLLTEMKHLQILNMTSNLLQTLPPKFGFVGKSLKHLYLHNNPLKQLENDYGYRVVGNSDGTTTNEEDLVCVSVENPQYTLWRCRQKYWIENKHHGQRPPDMKISVCGIQNECLLIQPEHRERIQRKIKDCFLSSSSSNSSSRTERKRRIRLGRNNDQIIQNSLVLTQLNLSTIPPDLIDFMEKNEMEVDDKSSKQQQERYRIHHLDLSRNNFSQSLNNDDDDKKPTKESFEFPPCFSILLSLSMKSCKINALSPTIQNMGSNRNSQRSGRLTCLNLNDNFLTNLPKEITRLRKLQNLILSNNILKGVPNLKELSNLTELILDANKLSNVPEGISSLRSLEKLSISRNHLTFIDLSILELKRLKYLNLMQNFIERLPLDGLNGMKSLSHLRLSGNKIKFLEDDCFSLWYSTKEKGSIWIDSNNLSDLPCGFEKINTNFIDLKFDKNPLQSPPIQEILLSSSSLSSHTQQERKHDDETEGETPIDTVMKYCENRSFRLNKMKKLLESKGNFEINHENFRPKVKDIFVLSSQDDDDDDETSGSKNSLSKTNLSIGYLQEKDLENFDKEVDQYINGKFYLYTTTAEKLVDDLIALRRKRQNQFFYHICQATINFFWNCYHYHQDDSWNGIQYRYDIQRPWGKDDELCSCFAFPIEFLNRDKDKNQEEESHSLLYKWILHEISSTDALDSSVVALLNQEVVVNALVTFKAPRMIARVEDINYSSNNNDEILEQHSVELKQKSIVICKMIYTKEESKRRQEEKDHMFDYFKKMEKQIDEYFSPLSPSNRGFLRQLDHEIKTNMIKNKKKLSDKKEEVKLLQRIQMIPAQEELLVAQRRKKDFEDGDKPFLYHRVKSQEEIDSIVKEKQDKLDDAKQRNEILNNQLESIQAVIKSHDRKKTEQERIDTLKKKYCFYIYDKVSQFLSCCSSSHFVLMILLLFNIGHFLHKIITYGRVWAHYNNLRRPWDGQDGIEFIQFQQEVLYSSPNSIDEEIPNEYELVSKEEFIEHLDKLVKYGTHSTDSSGIGGDIVDTPNFTWDDQEISQDIYDNQFYEKYRSVQSSNDIVSAIKIGVEKTVKKKKEGMIFHNLNFKKRFQLGGNKK